MTELPEPWQGRPVLHENDAGWVIEDKFPVTPGHLLVILREPLFDTPDEVALKVWWLIQWAEEQIEADGVNIGMNIGTAAGQTVLHPHIHIIPRNVGDTPNPEGGIRKVIDGSGSWE